MLASIVVQWGVLVTASLGVCAGAFSRDLSAATTRKAGAEVPRVRHMESWLEGEGDLPILWALFKRLVAFLFDLLLRIFRFLLHLLGGRGERWGEWMSMRGTKELTQLDAFDINVPPLVSLSPPARSRFECVSGKHWLSGRTAVRGFSPDAAARRSPSVRTSEENHSFEDPKRGMYCNYHLENRAAY